MVDWWDSPFLGPFESLWPQQLDAFPRMEAKPRCVLGISRPVSSQKPTIEDTAFYCTGKTVLISNKMLKKTTEEWKERKGRLLTGRIRTGLTHGAMEIMSRETQVQAPDHHA